MQQLIYPKKIVKSCKVKNEKNLLIKQEMQIDTYEPRLTEFCDGSFIILDFGKEMRGGIRVLCYDSDFSPIRVRFGESIGECCSDICAQQETVSPPNATNDHALRDFSIGLPFWSDTPLGDTGFRFVRLDFSGKYTVKSILCSNTILSKKAKYIYRGDKELEKIFKVAKRTVDLCAGSGYIWDGIKRDRIMWTGDLAPQVLALTTLYGKSKEVERSIEFARKQAALPAWMNGFPTYSMWWITTVKEYFDRTGERKFTESQLDYLEGLITQMADGVDENGELKYKGDFDYFVDWPRVGSSEEKDGARAINIMATKSAIFLFEKFGRSTDVAKAHLSRLMKKSICPQSKVVTALKYLAIGSLTEEEQGILLSGGIEGMSTFMSYYILKAVSSYNPELAVDMLKEYYGGMLSLGATTFWENFEPEQLNGTPIDKMPKQNKPDCHRDYGEYCYVGYRRSLCHGWAAGIIANIKELEAYKSEK